MYIGLSLMNEDELAEITRLIGVEQPPGSRDVLVDIVSGWIARAVKKEGRAQEEVERCVLEWTAESWKILIPAGTDTNDVERSLRLKIAQDAADFLSPGWVLCCALIAVGQESNIQAKLELMEEAASTAVPSQRARRVKRAEWSNLCSRWSKTDPTEELDSYLSVMKERPELQGECLSLGLALSLLDGKIGFPTERLYRHICDQLDMPRAESDDIKAKVNDLYWKHHNAVMPTQTKDGEPQADPIRSATQKTVYDAGALEALAIEARQRLFASLEPKDKKKSGWSKLVGGLSGMSPFFSNKMKNSMHATLARVVYHTILKQHDAVVVGARLAHEGMVNVLTSSKPQAPSPTPPSQVQAPTTALESKSGERLAVPLVATSTPQSAESSSEEAAVPDVLLKPVALSDAMVDTNKAPKRIIKLDL